MKLKLQLIFALFFLTTSGVLFCACDDEWEPDNNVLTDAAHGGLTNHDVVATGDVKNVTTNSATILISANYNYKDLLNIKPGLKYSDVKPGNYGFRYGESNTTSVEIINFTSSACEVKLSNLKPSTTYYYCAYATTQEPGYSYKEYNYGEIKSFTTPVDYSIIAAWDLGLSVKWANMNVGATSEEAEGGKFYWGGTETRIESYKPSWYSYGLSTLRDKRIVDSDYNLYSSYDAATQIWDNKWRMPTKDEFQELIDKCTWEKQKKDDEVVYKITGPSGKYIYLPIIDYWTSTADTGADAYYLHLTSSSWYIGYSNRSNIYSIRPVLK